MKAFTIVLSSALFILLTSCGSTTSFPISEVTPGADIKVNTSTDNHGNHVFSITAKNLTNPERLTPPRNVYVVWVKTQNSGTLNIGRINPEGAKKVTLKTLIPFEPQEIFITAEDEGEVAHPAGKEISRIVL